MSLGPTCKWQAIFFANLGDGDFRSHKIADKYLGETPISLENSVCVKPASAIFFLKSFEERKRIFTNVRTPFYL